MDRFSATVVTLEDGTREMRIGRAINNVDGYLASCYKNERHGGVDFEVVANGLTAAQVDEGILAACERHGVTHIRPAGRAAYAV